MSARRGPSLRAVTGLLLALAVAAAGLAWQQGRFREIRQPRATRFALPAFDAYVYVAMAEEPAVFTVAPWGHRLLTPALVHALRPNPIRGYRWVTLGGLALAGAALFLWLRRLGHPDWGALVAVGIFATSEPVQTAVFYPFLAEPVGVLLECLILLAVAAGAPLGVLAFLFALAALAKEVLLLLLPLVVMERWPREGPRRALRTGAGVALPAAVVHLLLRRWWWTGTGEAGLSLADLPLALRYVAEAGGLWSGHLVLYGVTPLALLALGRASARRFAATHGYLVAGFVGLSLLAGVYGGGPDPVPFFSADVPRLLVYALPPLLALVLHLLPRAPGPAAAPAWPPALAWCGAALAVLTALAPLALLDRYRRLDLRGPRDGPLVLAFCRESLRTAARLERGREVVWDAAQQVYVWGESDPGELERMRWFLREGWGERPHYADGPFRLQGGRGVVALPWTAAGRALELSFSLQSARPTPLRAQVNGRDVALTQVDENVRDWKVTVPAALLFRGDNLLTLEAAPAALSVQRIVLKVAS